MNRLATKSDMLHALEWAVEGLDPEKATAAGALLFDCCFASESLTENSFDRVFDGFGLDVGRKSRWTIGCALLAQQANLKGDLNLFWPAAIEVWRACQNGRQGKKKSIDPVSALIQSHLTNQPRVSPSELFNHFGSLANSFHSVFLDFDGMRITCALSPGCVVSIDLPAFRGRFSRTKKRMALFQRVAV